MSFAVGGALALLCLIWLATVGASATPWALLLWLYLACAAFVVTAVIGRFRGVVPDLPGLPERINGDPKLIVFAFSVVFLVTIAREGATAPDFVLNLNWWSASHTLTHDTSSTSSTTGELFYSGRPVFCHLTCSGDEVGCAVFRTMVNCNDREPAPLGVSIMGMVTIPEVSCYTPLSKDADVTYSADVSFSVQDGTNSKSSSLTVSGRVAQEMTGLASCYVFRQELAKVISRDLTGVIDGHLSAN